VKLTDRWNIFFGILTMATLTVVGATLLSALEHGFSPLGFIISMCLALGITVMLTLIVYNTQKQQPFFLL
jgi:hypothetical protein